MRWKRLRRKLNRNWQTLMGRLRCDFFLKSGHFHFLKFVYVHFHFLNLISRTVREETLMGKVKSQVEQTILALRDNSQHLPMKG